MTQDDYDLFNPPPEAVAFPSEDVSETEEEKTARMRERLLAKVKTGRGLDSVESRVAYLLSQYPDTRNSDITLQLQYWTVYQRSLLVGGMPSPDVYHKAERLTSIARARRHVQHDLDLFHPTDERVAQKRKQLSEAHRIDYAPAELSVPSIFVYADESGKNKAHLVVGSVWMLATGEYETFRLGVEKWKTDHEISYELHSSSLGKKRLEAYKGFIQEFVIDQGILGFKAVSIHNSGFSDEGAVFGDLFYLLLRRGLEHETGSKRAPLPRQVTFVKDAEEQGADERLQAWLNAAMQREAKTTFEGKLYFEAEESISSKSEVLIQIADLFTWSVSRKLNETPEDRVSWQWKDDFADWFLEAVKFTMDTADTIQDRAVKLSIQSPTLTNATTPRFETSKEELALLDRQND